jgi:hypothetical protein
VDGPWVPKLDESSIYTVIVYLNDDHKGGCTNFRSESTLVIIEHCFRLTRVCYELCQS